MTAKPLAAVITGPRLLHWVALLGRLGEVPGVGGEGGGWHCSRSLSPSLRVHLVLIGLLGKKSSFSEKTCWGAPQPVYN